jgi:hypothetical protein
MRLRHLAAALVSGVLLSAAAIPIAGTAPVQAGSTSTTCTNLQLTVSLNGQATTLALPALSPGSYSLYVQTSQNPPAEVGPIDFTVSGSCQASLTTSSNPPAQLTACVPTGVNPSGTLTDAVADYYQGSSEIATQDVTSGYQTSLSACGGGPGVVFTPRNLPPGTYQVQVVFTYSGGSVVYSLSQTYAAPLAQTAAVQASPSGATNVTQGLPTTITFTAVDSGGAPVPGQTLDIGVGTSGSCPGTITFSDLTPGSGGTVSGNTIVETTNLNGQASVTLTDNTVGDCGTVTAVAAGSSATPGATGLLTVVAATPTAISVTPASNTTTNVLQGTPAQVVFTLTQAGGVPAPDVSLTVKVSGTLNAADFSPAITAPLKTNGQGKVSLTYTDPTAGDTGTVTATVAGTSLSATSGTLLVTSTGPSAISLTSGASVTALTAGTPQSFTFQVVGGSSNQPLSGIPVQVDVTGNLSSAHLTVSGASASNPDVGTTDANGDVTVTYTGQTAGHTGEIVATVVGTSLQAATQVLTVQAGAPASVAVGSATAQETVGDTYQVTLTAKDADGNPVNGTYPVEVYGSVFQPSGGGTPSQFGACGNGGLSSYTGSTSSPSTANEANLAFSNGTATLCYVPEAAATGDTLGVALPGSPPVTAVSPTSITVTIPSGDTVASLRFLSGGPTLTAGVAATVAFEAEDSAGNAVPGVNVFFYSSGSGVSVETVQGQTNAQGDVSTQVLGTQAGASGTVTAEAYVGSTPITAVSPTLTVQAGPPSMLTVAPTGAQTVSVGGQVSYTFTVTDAFGNPVSGVPLGFVTSTGLNQQGLQYHSGTTGANGQFSLAYTGQTPGNSGTIQAIDLEAPAITVTTGTLTVTAVAAQVQVTPGGSSAITLTAGQPEAITATVTDSQGDPVPGVSVLFGIAPLTGSQFLQGTFSASQVATTSMGQATTYFTPTAVTPSGDTGGQVQAVAAGVSKAGLSAPFLVQAGSPAQFTNNLAQATSVAVNTPLDVTFTVQDQNNNPVGNWPVSCTLTGTLAAGTLSMVGGSGQSGNTNSSGQITFQYESPTAFTSTNGTVSGTIQCVTPTSMTSSSSSLTSTTPTITVIPGPNSSLTSNITSPVFQPRQSPLNVSFTLKDSAGDPIPGELTQWAVTGTLSLSDLSVSNYSTNAFGVTQAVYEDANYGDSGTIVVTTEGTSANGPQLSAQTATITIASGTPAAITGPSPVPSPVAGGPAVGFTFQVTTGGSSPSPVTGAAVSASLGTFTLASGASGTSPTLTTTSPQISDANGNVTFDIKPGTASGTGSITAQVTSPGGSGTVTVNFTVAAGTLTTTQTVLDPSGFTGQGYSTTPGYWLNPELAYGSPKAHVLQVTLFNQYGVPMPGGSYTVTAASGFLVGEAPNGVTMASSVSVTFNSNGVGDIYVQNTSAGAGDLASSPTSNGSIPAGTTVATVAGVNVNVPTGGVTTLYNPASGTLVSSATVSAANGETITIPASALVAPSSGTNYYYVNVEEYQPSTTNHVWVQISVGATANIGTSPYTLTIPTSGTSVTITQSGNMVVYVAASIAPFTGAGTTFAPTKGNIFEIGEVSSPVTTPATSAPTATNDGYVRAGA